ncbi:MAG: cupredoxin domain-containing protein [Actinomycetota bacterium]
MTRRTVAVLLLGALAAAMLVLAPSAAAGGGCHGVGDPSVARVYGDSVAVDVGKCTFSPTILYIEEGTTVTWDNFDPVPHTVTGVGNSLHGDEYLEANETPVSFTFDDAGVFPYYCILHPGMAAAVVVGDVDAQAAAADEAGAFVPPSNDVYKRIAAQGGSESPDPDAMPAWPALTAGAVAALAVIALGVFWRRRHPSLPTPAEQHSPAGP